MICVVFDIVRIETTTPVVLTRDNSIGSDRTLKRQERDKDDSTQRILLIRVTILVDTLAQYQGRSLTSQLLSKIFLTF